MRSVFIVVVMLMFAFVVFSCQEMSPTNTETDQSMPAIKQSSKKDDILIKGSKDGMPYIPANHYIVEFSNSEDLLNMEVNLLGGTVDKIYSKIKLAKIKGLGKIQAKKLSKAKGIKSVARDMIVQWIKPEHDVLENHIGENESYWTYQWALDAIDAPEAWDEGARGAGVRVAVIDGGLWYEHSDLFNNIDMTASAAFPDTIPFYIDQSGHATHVAGIIAAIDNDWGVIGVAPEATIIGLKALHNGSGSFSAIIEAILYAADAADADIINMSLGGYLAQNDDAYHLKNALIKAINYAHQNGVTVIASAGNDAVDMDHAGPWIHVPGDLSQVINVSATGPIDFAYGATYFDNPASYTNYGQSEIDFAAPGGDYISPNQYWYYDMVLSTTINGWSWMAGTSMAAPHVAGVAALIIEKNGGSMHPAQVKAVLRQSADDLGKPGKDDYYGHGRINAYKAVMQ